MAYDQSIKNKKILVINALIPLVFNFEKIFKDINFEIIHTIRHPLLPILDTKNWLKFKNGIYLKPKNYIII